jgi:hypothetical protein
LKVKKISVDKDFLKTSQSATYEELIGKSYIDVFIQSTYSPLNRTIRVYDNTSVGFSHYDDQNYYLYGECTFYSSSGEVQWVLIGISGWIEGAIQLNKIMYTI